MFLSDRDIQHAIDTGKLIVRPPPSKIDSSSFDLHLDVADEAKVWDIGKYTQDQDDAGVKRPELRIGAYNYGKFSRKYLVNPPAWNRDDDAPLVSRRADEIIIRPLGFVLWQTKEEIGTPPQNADFICFVEGKSTKARSGIVVHLTAPNIHVSWSGRIVLEIVNFGPFDLVLREGDAIAQVTVARITSPPRTAASGGQTYGQSSVHGT
jgi:dCTP deaminase